MKLFTKSFGILASLLGLGVCASACFEDGTMKYGPLPEYEATPSSCSKVPTGCPESNAECYKYLEGYVALYNECKEIGIQELDKKINRCCDDADDVPDCVLEYKKSGFCSATPSKVYGPPEE